MKRKEHCSYDFDCTPAQTQPEQSVKILTNTQACSLDILAFSQTNHRTNRALCTCTQRQSFGRYSTSLLTGSCF